MRRFADLDRVGHGFPVWGLGLRPRSLQGTARPRRVIERMALERSGELGRATTSPEPGCFQPTNPGGNHVECQKINPRSPLLAG